MEDVEKTKEGASSREWEVVSLTASAYAAEPGPAPSTDASKDKDLAGHELEFSRSMFMSGHFMFPPSEHENLPLEHEKYEIEPEAEEQSHRSEYEAGGSYKNQDEIWSLKGLSENDGLQSMELSEKEKNLSTHDLTVEEISNLQSADFDREQEVVYGGSFHGIDDATRQFTSGDDANYEKPDDHSCTENPDSSSDPSKNLKLTKGSKHAKYLSEAWWKQQAASLYAQAKEGNTFWSVFVAAALMGLVILGRRWQKDRWQVQQLKLKLIDHDSKLHHVVGPISRFKDVFIGVNRQGIAGISAER